MDYLEKAAQKLMDWYDASARTLPWRDEPTPYRVWVSEIMLQQTRVEAVLPYFDRFMKELPDIASLAAVEEEKLMLLWQGLGYYARARNLRKAAQAVMENYGGKLPSDFETLRSLPGIGLYTAGAIASIAFGKRHVAVDGNVVRVLSRLLESGEDANQAEILKQFGEVASKMQPADRPGDFNQALMELGAIVCIPNGEPKCSLCPWETLCRAHAAGEEQKYPVRKKRNPRKIEKRTVLVVTDGERILLRKRPEEGLLAGMWEFPNAPRHLPASAVNAQLRTWNMSLRTMEELPSKLHIFTHVEWHMVGKLLFVKHAACPEGYVWAPKERLKEYAIPAAFKEYYEAACKV
ncbi:MAG: A/G-specific adenine glycosylase [Clostridia bacterium]|nr:A/G-specific adenine glycosylase [Clostridia bacterium]